MTTKIFAAGLALTDSVLWGLVGVRAHALLAVAPDGSLLVGDDTNGVIYRVRYVTAAAMAENRS